MHRQYLSGASCHESTSLTVVLFRSEFCNTWPAKKCRLVDVFHSSLSIFRVTYSYLSRASHCIATPCTRVIIMKLTIGNKIFVSCYRWLDMVDCDEETLYLFSIQTCSCCCDLHDCHRGPAVLVANMQCESFSFSTYGTVQCLNLLDSIV